MDHPTNTTVQPAELQRARLMWSGFTEMAKYGILAVIGLLVLMAIFLL